MTAEQISLDQLLMLNSARSFQDVEVKAIRLGDGLQPSQKLSESVRAHGILQPILLNKNEDGTFECIAGARRLRAAKTCGITTVPAVVMHLVEYSPALLSLPIVENEIRENNLALASQHIDELFRRGADEEMLSGATNLSKAKVRAIRKIWTNLIPAFHQIFLTGQIRNGPARAIGQLTVPQQKEAYELFAANGKISMADIARIKLGGTMQAEELPGLTPEESWRPKARTAAMTLETEIRKGAKENTDAAGLLAKFLSLMEEYGLRGFTVPPAEEPAGDEPMPTPEDPEPAPADDQPITLPGAPDDLDEPVLSTIIPQGMTVDDVMGDEPLAFRRRKPKAKV